MDRRFGGGGRDESLAGNIGTGCCVAGSAGVDGDVERERFARLQFGDRIEANRLAVDGGFRGVSILAFDELLEVGHSDRQRDLAFGDSRRCS